MELEIGAHHVGCEHPLFVIAEIGLNHNGSLDHACALVDAAAKAGASAVKLQTLRADRLVAPGCPPPAHVPQQSLVDFFRQFELDAEAHRVVADRAHAKGLAFMATPFYEEAVDMLDSVGCDAFKIASGDLTYLGLIQRAARTGKPLVISTGMGELDEIDEAVCAAMDGGAREIALLHCVSAYPVPKSSQHLRAIADLRNSFALPVGLSDHGTDPMAAVIAQALGASLYEKHIVLDSSSDAIDAAVSANPRQLRRAILSAERTREALGEGRKRCMAIEAPNRMASRRGVYALRSLAAGSVITPDVITALRPAVGLSAARMADLIGRKLLRDIAAGSPVQAADIDFDDVAPDIAHLEASLTCDQIC